MLKDRPGQVQDVVIKIKSLQQKIRPITIGAGASRPYVYVIFDKEAAAQFASNTLVYLSWKHLGYQKTIGYNVFTKVADKPKNVWKIALPAALLKEGTVLARIELVDSRSIAASTNFEINVLYNPNEDEVFTDSADYTDFQKMVTDLAKKIEETQGLIDSNDNAIEELKQLFEKTRDLYQKMKCKHKKIDKKAEQALETSYEAYETAIQALNQLIWGELDMEKE